MLNWLFEALASATATVVFFSIMLVGFVFSAASIILGGHGDTDHDIGGHDFADHDFSHDAGHDSGHDSEHDGDGEGGGLSSFFSVGILSVRGMALFATGFGGIGSLVQIYTGKVLFSTVAGMLFGYSFAFVVLLILRVFRRQQSNSLIDTSVAVGMTGTVTTAIPSNGYGEVRVVVAAVEMTKMAMSCGGQTILSGTRVRVKEVDGSTFVVEPIQ
jgi:membrane protein implicated in regulation of membrane protease activity